MAASSSLPGARTGRWCDDAIGLLRPALSPLSPPLPPSLSSLSLLSLSPLSPFLLSSFSPLSLLSPSPLSSLFSPSLPRPRTQLTLDQIGRQSAGASKKATAEEQALEAERQARYPSLPTPVRLAALDGVPVAFVAAGPSAMHCLVGAVDGRLFSWGRNEKGQLGHGEQWFYSPLFPPFQLVPSTKKSSHFSPSSSSSSSFFEQPPRPTTTNRRPQAA